MYDEAVRIMYDISMLYVCCMYDEAVRIMYDVSMLYDVCMMKLYV